MKKQEYSTFDIAKIFGISRARVQEWIDREYITPSLQKAVGKGRRALFSIDDLYCIHAFGMFIKMQFHRNLAKDITSNITFKNVGSGDEDYKFLSIKAQKINSTHGFMFLRDVSVLKNFDNCSDKVQVKNDEYFSFIINLLLIKSEVDILLENNGE